jgi:homopolymeric O-antigen transport system permease protein
MSPSASVPDIIIIEVGRGNRQYWRDVWNFRELFYILALRDMRVRYRQTVIGVAWSVVRPLLTMLALTWVFSRGAQLRTPHPSIPYALWVFVATLPWQFFADALTAGSNSLIANANMLSKTYFPRLILPVARMMVSFLDVAVAFLSLLLLTLYFYFDHHFFPSWHVVFLPIWLLLAFLASIGLGCLFAALNVKYRDFTYIVPFIVAFGIYVSPVGLSSAEMTRGHSTARLLYSLNPMVGVIDGFRWCFFGAWAPLYWPGQLASIAVVVILLAIGIGHFRAAEREFADII